jgi:phage gp46-like protein
VADVRTFFIDFARGAEWLLDAPGLATDEGLDTAIILSLFTDARAKPDDATPAPDDLRGWWGDAFADTAGERFGSRLWLLGRRKQLPAVLVEAKNYAEEALAWLIKDGIASRVDVEAFIPRDEVLGLAITITRPGGASVRYRFETLWSAL